MSTSVLFQIAERVFKRPLLIHPDKLPLILAVIEGRLPIDAAEIKHLIGNLDSGELTDAAQAVLTGPAQEASRFFGSNQEVDPVTGKAVRLPYRRHANSAIIQVMGSLVNRGAFLGSSSGLTSYEGLRHQIAAAAADPRVESIILDISSPGGEALGAFETARVIDAATKQKPVIAVVNGMAASAAYALASAATHIVLSESSIVGSIGVVMLHADFSRQLDRQGITPTFIIAGSHKVDGNPYEPLSKAVHADLQAEVDKIYEMFVATVAGYRRSITAQQIRATEAQTYTGADAVSLGLADEVGTFEATIAHLTNRGSGRISHASRRTNMAQGNEPEDRAAATFTQAQLDLAVSQAVTQANATNKTQLDAAVTQATTATAAAGATAERARFNAILGSDEAKDRTTAARQVALTTDMAVTEAKKFLASLPKEQAQLGDGRNPSLGLLTGGVDNQIKTDTAHDLARKSAERINKRVG